MCIRDRDEPASSTGIREALRAGVCPVPHLNPEVESFISREGLYGIPRGMAEK